MRLLSNLIKNLRCDAFIIKSGALTTREKFSFLIKKYLTLPKFLVVKNASTTIWNNNYKPASRIGLTELQIMLKDFSEYYYVPISNKKPVIFDIGANVGNFSIAVSKFYPRSKIYAFEPVSSTYKTLENNTANTHNVNPFQIAFGDKKVVKQIFYTEEESDRASFYTNNMTGIIKHEKIYVITVDSFCQSHNITHIDLMKIDVEGFEKEVLKGATNIVANTKYVIIEIHLKKDGQSFGMIVSTLYARGFTLHKIGKTWRNSHTNNIEVADFVFINNTIS